MEGVIAPREPLSRDHVTTRRHVETDTLLVGLDLEVPRLVGRDRDDPRSVNVSRESRLLGSPETSE